MINTRFWIDDYISNLDPIEKLLFLYLLTNPSTDICGIYELPIKNIALDTGMDKEMVLKIIDRFSRDGKVFYSNGWVAIKNFVKHQIDNPKVQQGIKNGLDKAPQELIHRIHIDYRALSHSDSNLNSNLNSDSNLEIKVPTPREETINFFKVVEDNGIEYTELLSQFKEKTGIPLEIAGREIKKFYAYWTERNSTGKKQRWETEKTFEVSRRINTWLSKAGQWSKPTTTQKYNVGTA